MFDTNLKVHDRINACDLSQSHVESAQRHLHQLCDLKLHQLALTRGKSFKCKYCKKSCRGKQITKLRHSGIWSLVYEGGLKSFLVAYLLKRQRKTRRRKAIFLHATNVKYHCT